MADVRDYTNYLIYLCRCAVTGEIPKVGFPSELDFEKFFQFCYDHQLVGLSYDMIRKIETGYEGTNIMLIFKDKHNYAILKDASQDYYLGLMREAFSENDIDFTPLKGAVIKDLYPYPYYRQCTDMDILINKKDAARVNEIMEELGFKTETYGYPDETDNYRIDKFTYIEIHKELIPASYPQFNSCRKIPEQLILKTNHEYVMTDEDFYIFMIVHIAKHLKRYSVGIRAILDIWVYLRQKPMMDWTVIERELEKCELKTFHNKLMSLINYWFKDNEGDSDTKLMADYIGESGWNGTEEQSSAYVLSSVNAEGRSGKYIRLKNLYKLALPDIERMKVTYSSLQKYPFLLPICWISRWGRIMMTRRESISKMAHRLDNVDAERSAQINSMRRRFGL